MATVGIKRGVIDADAHVIESEHTWDYLLPHEEKFRPKLFASPENPEHAYWILGGKIIGHRNPAASEEDLIRMSAETGRDLVSTRSSRELSDVQERVRHIDELGIDTQVLHNTLWIQPVTTNPAVDVALCGSWNRWMADVWKQSAGRLRWCAVMPTLDMEASVEQIRFAKQNGAAAVAMRPLESGLSLADSHFYPIYEEAVRQDLAIAMHISNGSTAALRMLESSFDRAGGFAAFRIPTVMETLVLMMSEVPEVFPTLRWGIVEASANWVPWIVREVQQRYLARGRGAAPENILKHFNVYVTCETTDDIEFVIKHGGDENILIGTDYGHADLSSALDAIEKFKGLDVISDESKGRILYDNPVRLYGL
jgi:predicted TIM-barrel fold metal-dependent hydrolase